jgi:hypothetical protein
MENFVSKSIVRLVLYQSVFSFLRTKTNFTLLFETKSPIANLCLQLLLDSCVISALSISYPKRVLLHLIFILTANSVLTSTVRDEFLKLCHRSGNHYRTKTAFTDQLYPCTNQNIIALFKRLKIEILKNSLEHCYSLFIDSRLQLLRPCKTARCSRWGGGNHIAWQ